MEKADQNRPNCTFRFWISEIVFVIFTIAQKTSSFAIQRYKETLDTVFNSLPYPHNLRDSLLPPFVRWLCATVSQILQEEPNVIHFNGPAVICGDIHGNFPDLLEVFREVGLPPHNNFIFLGDYVDRGKYSVEVMCILLILKFKFPQNIFLLRGNHESKSMSHEFTFAIECKAKLAKGCLKSFAQVFNSLPLALILNNSIFCVHAGISPNITTLQEINNINRFTDIPDSGPFCDLLWSDPNPNVTEFAKSDRCDTFLWGFLPYQRFMEQNNLQMLIRGHQVCADGWEFPFLPDKSLITIYTSSSSTPDEQNRAAIISISPRNALSFTLLPENKPILPKSQNSTRPSSPKTSTSSRPSSPKSGRSSSSNTSSSSSKKKKTKSKKTFDWD